MIHRHAYGASFFDFSRTSDDEVLGRLTSSQRGDLTPQQRDAWLCQIRLLRGPPERYASGYVFFEFLIPRIGRRADVVLVVEGVVLVLEFKVGASAFNAADLVQTVDYALDLKNFHEGSRNALVAPVLVATEASDEYLGERLSEDGILEASRVGGAGIQAAIDHALARGRGRAIDAEKWAASAYHPTPTIVEAIQALFRGHSVAEISRSEAGADNLGATTDTLNRIIDRAKVNREKVICVVTGVPGAGKTLAADFTPS